MGWRTALFLVAGLFLPVPLASGQEPVSSFPPDLTTDVRSRLAEGARDAALEPWQREFMMDVARGRQAPAATEPSPALPALAQQQARMTADDGVWTEVLPPSARQLHTAIYDPVRDRMVVFGGLHNNVLFHSDVWALSWAPPVSVAQDAPGRLHLGAPRPNPSRGETTVDFDLVEPARVVLEVYDVNGRRVNRIADGWFPVGRHVSTWRGDDERGHVLVSGVYFIRVQVSGLQATRRTVLVR